MIVTDANLMSREAFVTALKNRQGLNSAIHMHCDCFLLYSSTVSSKEASWKILKDALMIHMERINSLINTTPIDEYKLCRCEVITYRWLDKNLPE